MTVAWICAVAPEFTFTLAGITDIATGATTETLAVLDLVGSATLVAVTTAVIFDVTAGAV